MTLEFRTLGFDPELVDYTEAFQLQQRLHDDVMEDPSRSTVLLLEHADVYTAGKRTEPHERPQDGTPVVDVDRGGKITWHGRGQLVGYPILHLEHRTLVKKYVCTLEDVIMKVLKEDYGIESTRVEGRTGVWILGDPAAGRPDRKIAAIGIRVHRAVTTHGFALNCSNEQTPFENIIPCGITDADTTSITREIGRTVTPAEVAPRIEQELRTALPPLILKDPAEAHGDTTTLVTDCSVSTQKKEVPA
ncbi:lipoyl(octanoyl) transferase LipB [Nesterenkonia flava]|uniref:Octanoyltransferase n=1 Tax=Nesterenkonia flava TaxID=469799 RepID=A0ABU1FRG2_9MICC|nr:lipoyl(octanoyl) transferase LipB [Nesterenkonia flava]MDR5711253.1 lipoyl(octanoyl) transferase LipB [Nesterenkonia flava]